jgi:hypothetical protein
MRVLLSGVHALLAGVAAHAGTVDEPYADAGAWQITTANHQACLMQSSYVIKHNGDEQTLVVFYDAKRNGAVLGWGTRKPSFRRSARLSTSSSLSPRYTHVFNGADGDRLLRDLASSDTVALSLGPVLMMTLPIDASAGVAKLRECSSRLAP